MCLFTNRSCYSACIRVLPLYSFDLPSFSLLLCKVAICGKNVMASVQGVKISEARLVLCLFYHVMKRVQHCWNWGVMAFTYQDMGHTFHEYILRIFCNGWLDGLQRYFSCCSLFILLCNGQNIAEYKVYWLISVPIINPWDMHQPLFLAKR